MVVASLGDVLEVPGHVPADLISDFDLFMHPTLRVDPHDHIAALLEGPRTIFLPRRENLPQPAYAGWLPTRSDDIVEAYKNAELFSNKGNGDFASMIGEKWILGPDAMDPPDHGKYRAILSPLFTPKALLAMDDKINKLASGLIDRFVDAGRCEFVVDFGRPFPVTIFMELLGLPIEDYEMVNAWEWDILHGGDHTRRIESLKACLAYLRDFMALRRRQPCDDLISVVSNAQVDGQPMSDDDVIGFLMLMFTAGLDTVAGTGAFIFKYLAEHPHQQARLRADPSLIPSAVEELLRYYAIVIPTREVTRDVEFAGVNMKKGDRLLLATMLAGRDPLLGNSDEIMFDRPHAHRHYAFGAGPHLCVGMLLARRELNAALQQWFARVPPFRVADGTVPLCHGGGVFGVERLEISWV